MKLLLNIFYERLHRKVYDKIYIPDVYRHHGNQLTDIDFRNEKIYNYLSPYFIGWRESLKINLWFLDKYKRYEPKQLDLMNYEFDKLSIWNKFIYSIRFELKKRVGNDFQSTIFYLAQ